VIDLTSFPACCSLSQSRHQCTYLCYASYRHRLKHFLEYLIDIRPVIRTLKFALDIDDPADGYRCLLSELIRVRLCLFLLLTSVFKGKGNVDLYSAYLQTPITRSDMALIIKGSHSFTYTPCLHPFTCLCLPANAGPHLPTPNRWKAE